MPRYIYNLEVDVEYVVLCCLRGGGMLWAIALLCVASARPFIVKVSTYRPMSEQATNALDLRGGGGGSGRRTL
jgi:hypothetical protein